MDSYVQLSIEALLLVGNFPKRGSGTTERNADSFGLGPGGLLDLLSYGRNLWRTLSVLRL